VRKKLRGASRLRRPALPTSGAKPRLVALACHARSLSRVSGPLRVPMFRVDMQSASTGAVLDGLSISLGRSSPGELFKTLAWGRGGVAATANPVAFLDEIDQVSGGTTATTRSRRCITCSKSRAPKTSKTRACLVSASTLDTCGGSCAPTTPKTIPKPMTSRSTSCTWRPHRRRNVQDVRANLRRRGHGNEGRLRARAGTHACAAGPLLKRCGLDSSISWKSFVAAGTPPAYIAPRA
jgi:hypothetical protein